MQLLSYSLEHVVRLQYKAVVNRNRKRKLHLKCHAKKDVSEDPGFGQISNPGLCTSNEEIFKILLDESFRSFQKPSFLVSDVPLMSCI